MRADDAFEELVRIMERLRGPGGCPWDREQTHQSIKRYLIEEAHEVAEAIDRQDFGELCSELGDLMLQIVFHAQMAREAGRFTIEDVVRGITEKMRRRHPHVFGDVEVSGANEVLRNWARIKQEEKQAQEDRSLLSGVPRSLPALQRAHRLGEKASHVGFDWPDAPAVLSKVREELTEFEQALAARHHDRAAEELGDLLFACASLARHLRLHAEDVLQAANERFLARFRWMEGQLEAAGKDPHALAVEEWDRLWTQAKQATSSPTEAAAPSANTAEATDRARGE